jgi:hypothetical protein
MQKRSGLAHRDNSQGTGPTVGHRIGALQRIQSDVYFGTAGAYFFPNVQHGCFIALTFADDYGTIDGHCVERLTHGIYGRLIGRDFVALAHPPGGRQSGCFGNPNQFQG